MSYYKTAFPFEAVFEFLCLHTNDPSNCEIATTTQSGMWRRYQTAKDATVLQKLLLASGNGATLHLGPRYSEVATHGRNPHVKILGKPLPFDLDLSDVGFLDIPKTDQHSNDRYIRIIFSQAHVLKAILHEVFGFEHFIAIYSGRRGVHLWTLDKRADALEDDARKAIATFVTPAQCKDDATLYSKRSILQNPSFQGPIVQNALAEAQAALFRPHREGGVGLFDSKTRIQLFLNRLFVTKEPNKWEKYDNECATSVRKAIEASDVVGLEAFDLLTSIVERKVPSRALQVSFARLKTRLENVVFSLIFPSIDAAVTASRSHCIKAPFSCHAATNRVAVALKDLIGKPGIELPPIVDANDIASKQAVFDESVSIFKTAVRLAKRGVFDGDIEEYVR